MNDTQITTTADLTAAIWQAISADATRTTHPDGTEIYRNGDRFFMISEELEDDNETLWGWTWSTGEYDVVEGREIEEYFSTDGGQDGAEAVAVAVRHLGALER